MHPQQTPRHWRVHLKWYFSFFFPWNKRWIQVYYKFKTVCGCWILVAVIYVTPKYHTSRRNPRYSIPKKPQIVSPDSIRLFSHKKQCRQNPCIKCESLFVRVGECNFYTDVANCWMITQELKMNAIIGSLIHATTMIHVWETYIIISHNFTQFQHAVTV